MNTRRFGKSSSLLALTLSLGLLLSASNSFAQVYKRVDEQGNVSYSDQPAPDAKPVEIQETNSAKSVEVPIAIEPLPTAIAPNSYDMVRINSPAHDSVIANGLVPFNVSTSVKPKLKNGHQLQLTIDGATYGKSLGDFTVDSINRGEHFLRVSIVDTDGNILKQSSKVKVFAYRPSTAGSTSTNDGNDGSNRPQPENPIAKPPVTIQPIPGPGRPNLGSGGGGRGR